MRVASYGSLDIDTSGNAVHSNVKDEHIQDTNSEGNNDEVAKAGDATCGIIATIFGETRHQPFVLTIIVTEQ